MNLGIDYAAMKDCLSQHKAPPSRTHSPLEDTHHSSSHTDGARAFASEPRKIPQPLGIAKSVTKKKHPHHRGFYGDGDPKVIAMEKIIFDLCRQLNSMRQENRRWGRIMQLVHELEL